MKIELDLTKPAIEKFCKDFKCSKEDIEPILMAYFNNDTEYRNYRKLGETFDVDNFLLTHSPAVLLTMRTNAMSKRKVFVPDK